MGPPPPKTPKTIPTGQDQHFIKETKRLRRRQRLGWCTPPHPPSKTPPGILGAVSGTPSKYKKKTQVPGRNILIPTFECFWRGVGGGNLQNLRNPRDPAESSESTAIRTRAPPPIAAAAECFNRRRFRAGRREGEQSAQQRSRFVRTPLVP